MLGDLLLPMDGEDDELDLFVGAMSPSDERECEMREEETECTVIAPPTPPIPPSFSESDADADDVCLLMSI